MPGTQEAHFLPSTSDLHLQPPLKSQEQESFASLHSEGSVPYSLEYVILAKVNILSILRPEMEPFLDNHFKYVKSFNIIIKMFK